MKKVLSLAVVMAVMGVSSAAFANGHEGHDACKEAKEHCMKGHGATEASCAADAAVKKACEHAK
jgi:hypothetical protein